MGMLYTIVRCSCIKILRSEWGRSRLTELRLTPSSLGAESPHVGTWNILYTDSNLENDIGGKLSSVEVDMCREPYTLFDVLKSGLMTDIVCYFLESMRFLFLERVIKK